MSPAEVAAGRRVAARIYLVAPFVARHRLDDPHVRRHYDHARTLTLAVVTALPFLVAALAVALGLGVRTGALVLAGLFAIGPVAWIGLGSLRAARRGDPPPLHRWTGRVQERHIRRWRQSLFLSVLLALLGLLALVRRGERLAERVPGTVPRCWLLFDDNLGCAPLERKIHCLGFARIAAAANERWGPGAAVVEPLGAESLRQALASGSLVFVASHGAGGKIPLEGVPVDPELLQGLLVPGPDLQLVYFGACEAGQARWDEALAPATVIAHPRLTTVSEHGWWLWVEAPALMRRLAAEGTLGAEERIRCPAPR